MIEHYPNATQLSDLQRPGPPTAVLHAVRVMYAGAVFWTLAPEITVRPSSLPRIRR